MATFVLSSANAASYFASHGLPLAAAPVELGGGVSNAVLLLESSDGRRLVAKQSLSKLRVEQDWYADRERIHREAGAIRRLQSLLQAGDVPEIVFEDRENCIYAMIAAPANYRPWKPILLDGVCDARVAGNAARVLASMIMASREGGTWKTEFGDRAPFDQLRLDPYYRATAARHPDLSGFFDDLIGETLGRQYSLVHGDWSPKNILVAPTAGGITAIDFEVIHFGDPAFDVAFLMNHLLLKSIFLDCDYRWAALAFFHGVGQTIRESWLGRAAIRHLGALMLARIDGKSPVEYIADEAMKERVRRIARGLILNPPPSIAATMERT